jgi:outer membrane receptor protein involved in Fe transport
MCQFDLQLFRRGRWLAAFAVVAIDLAAMAPALAADDEEPAQLQEVVVTGSRIAAPNLTSTSPIQVISSKTIQQTGKNDISDVLLQLPQNFNNSIGQDFSGSTSGLTAAGGITTADLRGLGPNRTLVLIDGRRLGNGSPNTAIASPAPDLDQIPITLVERIDVVTGGASSVYGSDAIAGVVNFIMKKNFEGIQFDGQVGESIHHNHNEGIQALARDFGVDPPTGTVKDGRNRNFSLTMGTNFAEGKGNVTAYFGYLQTDPVYSGDRDFGSCQLEAISAVKNGPITGTDCTGSGNSNRFTPLGTTLNGVFTGAKGGQLAVVGNQLLPWPATGQVPPPFFNSQPYITIGRQDQRYTAGFMAHDAVTDYLQPYMDFGFMNDKSTTFVAPSALFENSNPLDSQTNYTTNCSNPLLSAQQLGAIGCTPALIAADTAAPGSALANIEIGRRNVEGGPRSAYFEHTNYRAVVGAKGDFADAWNYDAYGSYYYTTFFNSNNGFLNFQSIDNALLVTGTAANPSCISGPPCVPYNIWNQGAVTRAQTDPMLQTGTAYGSVTERILHVDVTGDLGKYGIKLPTANDGIGVNVGWEHRNDHTQFAPDSSETSGLLSGFGGASVPIDNSITVKEEFFETRVPLVQDKWLAKDLMVDAGYRHSQYDLAGGVNTYKVELQWAPIQDVRLRASYNRAIRAPTIIELFNPHLVGQITAGEDPCAPDTKTHVASATFAQCQNSGVTTAQYGNGIQRGQVVGGVAGTNDIPQGTGSQLTQLQGGNTGLKPEQADTYTIGANLTPQVLPNFSASIDYWHIKLKDEINAYPAPAILQNCLDNGDPVFCAQIVRSASNGGLTGASIASGGYLIQTNKNIGAVLIDGIDLDVNYKLPLDAWGSVGFALNGSYLIKDATTPYSGAHTYDCAGLFGAVCQTVTPKWRHVARASWETPWNVDLTLSWRYIGKVSLDQNSSDPTLNFASFGVYDQFNREIPGYSYLDLAAAWNVYKGVQIRGGINNLLDKDPPVVTSEITAGGAANTYETYDLLGRQIYLAVTAKF